MFDKPYIIKPGDLLQLCKNYKRGTPTPIILVNDIVLVVGVHHHGFNTGSTRICTKNPQEKFLLSSATVLVGNITHTIACWWLYENSFLIGGKCLT